MKRGRFTEEMGYSVRSPGTLCLSAFNGGRLGLPPSSGGDHGVCRARRVVELNFSLSG